jgi:6-phosphogluconolactonase
MELRIYKDKQQVAEHFAQHMMNLVTNADEFHVALSGGSTPKVLFDLLAEKYAYAIDWEKVHFYWGDERCVPPEHADSNYKMTVEHLFSKVNVPKENIHRILGEEDPKKEAIRYGALLSEQLPVENSIPQFDMVILGMGDDGHTASIFPHEIELWNANTHCVVATHPESGQIRVSLSGQVINNAKEVAFLVTGSSKAEKVYEIVEGKGAFQNYPANLVLPESGKLLWFLDEDAAARLASF